MVLSRMQHIVKYAGTYEQVKGI